MTTRRPEPGRVTPDMALWQEAVRGVAPLRQRAVSPAAPVGVPAANQPAPVETGSGRRRHMPVLARFAGIDRATAERLRRGLRRIEARLDLHGMTQREAHRALAEFIGAESAAGRRCLLVVTGRGLGTDGPGVLKTTVPRWLEDGELRSRVLAVAPAQPRHGGSGALYVLLRRRR